MRELVILQDDREKTELDFSYLPVTVKVERLEVGDYTTPALKGVAAVERKGLNDLATCAGSDRDRFQAQIERGAELPGFAVVIDSPREPLQAYADSGAKRCPLYYSRIYPRSVVGTVDSWSDRYGIEFKWYENPAYAAMGTYNLLLEWEEEFC